MQQWESRSLLEQLKQWELRPMFEYIVTIMGTQVTIG
jgi:hypothetical protein